MPGYQFRKVAFTHHNIENPPILGKLSYLAYAEETCRTTGEKPALSRPSRRRFPPQSQVVLQDLDRGACQGRMETSPISTTVPSAEVAATEVVTHTPASQCLPAMPLSRLHSCLEARSDDYPPLGGGGGVYYHL